ncbi:MAG: hypothetical protein AABZ64_16475 [Nitrospinota bacterium]
MKAHVECGSTPPGWNQGGTTSPSQPSGPSPAEIERQREEEEARRKEEEARKREEENRRREEAERQRRLREEQARERREFLKNKSEAIQSLKGIDFDGSGRGGLDLKSLEPKFGTSTFGVQPNPGPETGLKPLEPPQAAWREPLFSKGSPFSAPVDIREKDPGRLLRIDPEKVDGLIPGGDLGRLLSGKPWPPAAKSEAAAGFLMWERGNFAQARWYLARASALAPNDKFLQDALQKLESAQEKARAKLPPRENQAEAAASMVAAAGRSAVGDTSTALRLVERAAQLWPQNPDIQKSLKRVREVHAARKDLPAPAEVSAQHERAALWARGQAAFKLGLILAAQSELSRNAEQRNDAMIYLAEASFALRGQDREVIDTLRDRLKRGEPLYNPPAVSESPRGFYPTKADAMLDALEYGKGNWEYSFRYLRHVQQAFPSDRTVAAAIAELAAIQKSEDPRVSTK